MRIQDLLRRVAEMYGFEIHSTETQTNTCKVEQETKTGRMIIYSFFEFNYRNNMVKIDKRNKTPHPSDPIFNLAMSIAAMSCPEHWDLTPTPKAYVQINNVTDLFHVAYMLSTDTTLFVPKNRAIALALLLGTSPHSPYYLEDIPHIRDDGTDTAAASTMAFFLSRHPRVGGASPARVLPDEVRGQIAGLTFPPHPLRDLLRLNNTGDRTQYNQFLLDWSRPVLHYKTTHPELEEPLGPLL